MADRTNNPGTTGNTGSDRSQTDRQNPDLNTEEGGMSGSSGRDSLTDRSRSNTGNTGSRGGNTSVTGDEASEEGGMSGSSGRSDRESETTDRQTSEEGYGSSRGIDESGSTGNR
jgi:hypothetical protein